MTYQHGLNYDELIIDLFAGGGGASSGIERTLGRSPDIAINHDAEALAMHCANHPSTRHYQEDVFERDPYLICGSSPVGLLWFSPDCKHHSKAKGGKPKSKRIRGLAWVGARWAATVKPRVMVMENVEEFQDWGPLDVSGQPMPEKKGTTFNYFVGKLKRCGYHVEWRVLKACDYGAPTTRKRLFLIARCDGLPISWPEITHGTGKIKHRAVSECIDWSIECPSIFTRKKPLAEATERRIYRGLIKFVIDNPDPFITPEGDAAHILRQFGTSTGHTADSPSHTVMPEGGGKSALVTPFMAKHYTGVVGHKLDRPLGTVTTVDHHSLVAATMVQTGYGERVGQAPRALDVERPLGTIVAGGSKHALVAANLMAIDNRSSKGSCASDAREPMRTVTVENRFALVQSFLVKYYGQGVAVSVDRPLDTITTKHRMGLVNVYGENYQIVDIGLRMLQPHELFKAQGFDDDYIIDPVINGKRLSKTAQVRMCGNSVSPNIAAAIVGANYQCMPAEATA